MDLNGNDLEVLLRPEEVAKFLGIHPQTLHRMRLRGEGPPYFAIGGRFRYQLQDVESWLNEQKR